MASQPPADDSYRSTAEPDPYRPTVEPKPLAFERISDDGRAATYQAQVPGPGEPGEPAIYLAVTVASSISKESKEFREMLGRMRAAFDVLPELPPDWDVPDGDDDGDGDAPLDLEQEIRMELRLAWPDEGEPVAVIVTVETTAGIVPAPGGPQKVPSPTVAARFMLKQGLSDHWYANYAPAPTAHVHVNGGQGTMGRPGSNNPMNIHVPQPWEFKLPHASQFIVHAIGGPLYYTLNSGFHR